MSKMPSSYLKRFADIQKWLGKLGSQMVEFLESSGEISILFWRSTVTALTTPLRWKATVEQAYKIGVASLPLVMMTSLFTGIVLALQSSYQLRLFSAEQFTSDLVSLSITRELGPVLTAMMVAGRVGASMAAELGTMKVTEQIDAIEALGSNPVNYLVIPRFIASTIMFPVITVFTDLIGFIGSYIVSVYLIQINPYGYLDAAERFLKVSDVMGGLFKALIFGAIISIIASFKGLSAKNGAKGVGEAATASVVISLISIFIANYFLSVALFK